MDRSVIWSDEAVADLDGVAEYIGRDSHYYAAAFVQEVLDAVAALREFSERGQIAPEYDDASLRELLIAPYRIIYEVLDDKVLVLAIVHGARRSRRG